MIYTASVDSYNGNVAKVSEFLGSVEVNNLTINNNHNTINLYVGDQDVSTSNYGLRILPGNSIILPFMDLSLNDNLYVYAELGSSFSLLGWYGIHPVFSYGN